MLRYGWGLEEHMSKQQSVYEAYRWANREGRKVSEFAATVLVELMTYMNTNSNSAYPKRVTLARNIYDVENPTKSQLNRISSTLSKLEAAGLIRKEQTYRDGRLATNHYWIRVGEPAQTAPRADGHCDPRADGHWRNRENGRWEHRADGHLKYPVEESMEVSTEREGGDEGPRLRLVK